MKRFLTHWAASMLLLLAIQPMHAQYAVVWPTADTVTIRMSQFADSSSIFSLIGNKTPPAGFRGWTTKGLRSVDPSKADSAIWAWTANGRANTGVLYGVFPAALNAPIVSNTARGNGAAIFNSDFLDSRGTSGQFVNTPAIGSAPSDHCGELRSPLIDARGYRNMSVVFTQVYRHNASSNTNPCFSSCAISWSEDNGKTWKDTLCILENEVVGQYSQSVHPVATATAAATNAQRVAVRLPNSVGTDSFRIKFIFDGDYFFWLIDDIQLAQINNNLMIDPTYAARPTYYGVPHTQTDSIVFATNVINAGASRATGVKVQAYVLNDSSQRVLYTQTVNVGTLNPGQMSGPIQFSGKYAYPRFSVGTKFFFTGYRVTSDSVDQYPINDSLRAYFTMRDSLYRPNFFTDGKAFLPSFRPADAAFSAGQAHSWKVGIPLYVTSPATAVTFTPQISSISDFIGRTMNAGLYKWTDANNDGRVQRDERDLIGAAERVVPTGASGSTVFNMYWVNLNGAGPIILQPNTTYLAMFEFNSTGPTDDLFMVFNDGYWNNANMDAYRKAGRPRYYGVINNNANDETAAWSTNIFSGSKYAQTTLTVDPARDTISPNQYVPSITATAWPVRTDTKDLLNEHNKMSLFPNPVADVLKVDLSLEKMEALILLRVIDVHGKILMEREYNNVKQDIFELPVGQLPKGTYSLQLQTLTAYKTHRFVIAK
jgi:hypothetical protein